MVTRTAAVLVLLLAASACSDGPTTPTSPSGGRGSLTLTADQLAGTWRLTSMQVAGQAAQSTPSGASYTLTLEEGRLSTRADCNVCTGAFTLSSATLNAGPAMACTKAACPTMAFESAYTTILSGEHAVTLSGTTLMLTSSRGTLSFARQGPGLGIAA